MPLLCHTWILRKSLLWWQSNRHWVERERRQGKRIQNFFLFFMQLLFLEISHLKLSCGVLYHPVFFWNHCLLLNPGPIHLKPMPIISFPDWKQNICFLLATMSIFQLAVSHNFNVVLSSDKNYLWLPREITSKCVDTTQNKKKKYHNLYSSPNSVNDLT